MTARRLVSSRTLAARAAVSVGTAVALGMFASCTYSVAELSQAVSPGAGEGGAVVEDGASPVADGAAADVRVDAPRAPCPDGMIRTGEGGFDFCIDRTPVTNAAYKRFLDETAGSVAGQRSECAWNASFTPADGWPADPSADPLPVVHVDWCDAAGYCQWAGRRLCGGPKGEAMDLQLPMFANMARAEVNEWVNACSSGGRLAYPYGLGKVQGACNCDGAAKTREPVASRSKCQTTSPGVFDMTGNVFEWIAACFLSEEGEHADESCYFFGTSFDWPCSDCYRTDAIARRSSSYDLGFRCCAT